MPGPNFLLQTVGPLQDQEAASTAQGIAMGQQALQAAEQRVFAAGEAAKQRQAQQEQAELQRLFHAAQSGAAPPPGMFRSDVEPVYRQLADTAALQQAQTMAAKADPIMLQPTAQMQRQAAFAAGGGPETFARHAELGGGPPMSQRQFPTKYDQVMPTARSLAPARLGEKGVEAVAPMLRTQYPKPVEPKMSDWEKQDRIDARAAAARGSREALAGRRRAAELNDDRVKRLDAVLKEMRDTHQATRAQAMATVKERANRESGEGTFLRSVFGTPKGAYDAAYEGAASEYLQSVGEAPDAKGLFGGKTATQRFNDWHREQLDIGPNSDVYKKGLDYVRRSARDLPAPAVPPKFSPNQHEARAQELANGDPYLTKNFDRGNGEVDMRRAWESGDKEARRIILDIRNRAAGLLEGVR
jgi:hypothetical protein